MKSHIQKKIEKDFLFSFKRKAITIIQLFSEPFKFSNGISRKKKKNIQGTHSSRISSKFIAGYWSLHLLVLVLHSIGLTCFVIKFHSHFASKLVFINKRLPPDLSAIPGSILISFNHSIPRSPEVPLLCYAQNRDYVTGQANTHYTAEEQHLNFKESVYGLAMTTDEYLQLSTAQFLLRDFRVCDFSLARSHSLTSLDCSSSEH